MKKLLLIIPFAVMLTSCASSYKPSGFNGGFEEFKLNNDSYRVSFHGNGFTSTDLSYQFALRRAAELTKEAGHQYFVIIDSSTNIDRSYHHTPTQIVRKSNYNTDSTFVSGGSDYTIDRPTSYVSILFMDKNVPGAIDADVILSNFEKKTNNVSKK